METNIQPQEQVATLSTIHTPSLVAKVEGLLAARPIILQLLRFGAIGVFNTAMDVLVLNYMSSQFDVTKGSGIGWVNLPGFALAVIQSYYWNKYWAFNNTTISLLKNFLRLAGVGFVGVVVYGLVVLGAHYHTRPVFFLFVFAMFIAAQVVLWYSYGFFRATLQSAQRTYLAFYGVSIIGFLINTGVLYLIITFVLTGGNAADNLNIAKLLAVFVALIWNFIGYKLLVFRK